ncbi:hypothetical protein C8R46DRAFT_1082779, partial [Mycena filopes]
TSFCGYPPFCRAPLGGYLPRALGILPSAGDAVQHYRAQCTPTPEIRDVPGWRVLKRTTQLAFLGTSHLKHLAVSGGATQNIRGLPVRWENLTHLSATGYNDISLSSSDVLELLAGCSQLRECRLYLNQANNSLSRTDGHANNSIQLPFLQSFHISCFSLAVGGIGDILRRISLPKLRNLEFR